MIQIEQAKMNFVREPLRAPFGFKGKYVSELWQVAACLKSRNGNEGVGLGVQSPLWCDSNAFAHYGELSANSIMLLITAYALRICEGKSFDTPIDLLDRILPDVLSYSREITGMHDLKETYALNALVAVDNAAWQLYARETGRMDFMRMMPEKYRSAMPFAHEKLAGVPLITYGISIDEIKRYVNEDSFFLKIKIGNDPAKDGDPGKMLEWDKHRILEIHSAVRDIKTPYTESGHIPYYLDANGRYDSKEQLMELINYSEQIGALDRIILLEEPFKEENTVNVSDIPVRLAADESAHSDKHALERIKLGYTAMALKPIAKTLSMTLKVLKIAYENDTPCFCADLTVNPVMVDWNKNVAARINLLPGMKIGVLESNGHQNYVNWKKMNEYHPMNGATWIGAENGIYNLDDSFYQNSGGIFKDSTYYTALCK